MSYRVALFVYDSLRRIDLRIASHLWLARRVGFRAILARWRDVRAGPDGTTVSGIEVDEGLRLRRLRSALIDPALIVHRKLVGVQSERLFAQLGELHPRALLSYAPPWKPISWKWTCEKCFQGGERTGLQVARPLTFLISDGKVPGALRSFAATRPIIFKPSMGSQCYGIRLATPRTFDTVAGQLGPGRYVAQELVTDPLLYDRRKIDLRLYALVTSFSPLQFRVFAGGVVRIAGCDFDPDSPESAAAALTGNSYRKRRGLSLHNLALEVLFRRLGWEGYDVEMLWNDIDELMRRVFQCLARHPSLATTLHLHSRFYLCGVDLLLVLREGRVRPLFLETNYVPQLNAWGKEVDRSLHCVHLAWLEQLRNLYGERCA
jgi:Tubulin-tyrosine ligase family